MRFINHEEGRIVPDVSQGAPKPWEYQYFLKDHLGSVRVTFSEKKTTNEYVATMERVPESVETVENSQFLNINSSKKIDWSLFNHTEGAGKSYSYRLSGAPGEVVGPAKSLAVGPGDVVDLEVFVKYNNPQGTGSDVSGLLSALIGAFNLSPTGSTAIEGPQAYNSFNDLFSPGPYIGRVPPYEDESAPKAYLNYIFFDENFVLQDFGFDQVSTAARQGTPPSTTAHELLSLHVKVQKKGYLYIYLSNENGTLVDVFFDDFKIVHHTGVEQIEDYYPFGLTFNSYHTAVQNYKYNGKEEQAELSLGWLDYNLRMYQPELGRWNCIDPLTEKYLDIAPYAYVANNPVAFIDPNGAEIWLSYTTTDADGNEVTTRYQYKDGKLYGEDGNEYKSTDKTDPFMIVKDQLNSIKEQVGDDDEVKEIFSTLESDESDDHTIAISFKSEGNKNKLNSRFLSDWFGDNSTTTTYNPIDWSDPDNIVENGRKRRDPRIGLLHELRHAYDRQIDGSYEPPDTGGKDVKTGEFKPLNVLEARAVNTENILRIAIYGTPRTTYFGVAIPEIYLKNSK